MQTSGGRAGAVQKICSQSQYTKGLRVGQAGTGLNHINSKEGKQI